MVGSCARILALSAAGLAGCAGGTFAVESAVPAARLFVDGREQPASRPAATRPATRRAPEPNPIPYYGTVVIDLLPQEGPGDRWQRDAVRRQEPLPEPVTPWLFPFDFPLECLHSVFHGQPALTARVDSERRAGLVPAVLPPRSEEVRLRAQAIRTVR